MKTLSIYSQKFAVSIVFAAVLFTASAYLAHAQVYYPTTYQVPTNNNAQIQSLLNQVYALMAQVKLLQQQSTTYTYTVTPQYVAPSNLIPAVVTPYTSYGNYYYGSYNTSVSTEGAQNIDGSSVALSGNVQLGGAPYATVWFEYGTDGYITQKSATYRVNGNGVFTINLSGLSNSQHYYYRAVVEDPAGNREYGTLQSLTMGSYNNNNWNYNNYHNYNGNNYDHNNNYNYNNIPDASTEGTNSVTSNSAEMRGTVSMNSYDNGTVFFVYGEDRNKVQDVDSYDSYSDIRQSGQSLQKAQVDSSLDGTRTYWASQYGLDSNSRYYYSICVGYDSDRITCGDVESFDTAMY